MVTWRLADQDDILSCGSWNRGEEPVRFQAAKAKAKWMGVRTSAEASLNRSHLVSVERGSRASSLPVPRTSMSSYPV